jgi:hypothetical protein
VFASPEAVAAAVKYVAAQLALLDDGTAYAKRSARVRGGTQAVGVVTNKCLARNAHRQYRRRRKSRRTR